MFSGNIVAVPNPAQALGLEIFLIAEIGYIWLQCIKNRSTPTLAAFFRLCSALMLFLFIDVPVRLADLSLVSWPASVLFVLNGLYIALETFAIYEWYLYFLTVQGAKIIGTFRGKLFVACPMWITLVLLALSYKTKWLFFIDENSMYARGPLFALQFAFCYIYLIASFISALLVYRRERNKRLLSIFLSAFSVSLVSATLQVLYSGSFTNSGLCLAVTIVYVRMCQEELKQLDKMRSLSDVNTRLEEANRQLGKTITELEISAANEKRAHDAKNDFLSRMSHDIRTPLNGILGIIEMDNRHPDDVELLSRNRKKAKIAAEHLASLVNDVLDMSKLSAGKCELGREPFRMDELVDSALSIVRPRAAAADIILIDENEGDSFTYPETYGSKLHISRILINIIGNAIKYNKPGGSVKVKLGHEYTGGFGIKYTVTIADTGIGMSPEFCEKLFEPFSQERSDARSVFEGTGLGMTITKTLIDKMDGSIQVHSVPGEGSVFTVGLTFEMVQSAPDSRAEAGDNTGLDGLKILLAEDNELNTEIAVTLLEDCGALVTAVPNGKQAFDKFALSPEGTYDVILMDCMMPVLDGYGATRAIRNLARPDAETIPIIAMTANAFTDDVKKCLSSGMNGHIAKPFELETVKRTIRRHLPSNCAGCAQSAG